MTPSLIGKRPIDFIQARTFLCPSYPDKNQLIGYVVNGWTFSSAKDKIGQQHFGAGKMEEIRRPSDTIYLADVENATQQTALTNAVYSPALGRINYSNGAQVYYDVWSVNHLPYNNYGVENSIQVRRVAKDRHGKGPNLLYFDGHSAFKQARKILVEDWRDKR